MVTVIPGSPWDPLNSRYHPHDTTEMVGILEVTSLSSDTKAVHAHIVYGSCQIDMTTLNPGCLEQAFALTLLHGFSTVRWTTDLQLPVTVIPGVICYDSTTKHGRYMLALNIYMDQGLREMVISKSDPRVILGSCKC